MLKSEWEPLGGRHKQLSINLNGYVSISKNGIYRSLNILKDIGENKLNSTMKLKLLPLVVFHYLIQNDPALEKEPSLVVF